MSEPVAGIGLAVVIVGLALTTFLTRTFSHWPRLPILRPTAFSLSGTLSVVPGLTVTSTLPFGNKVATFMLREPSGPVDRRGHPLFAV